MKNLEKNIYIYSVEAIGWAKSMEKTPADSEQLKTFKFAAGNMYKQFSDAVISEDNKVFADHLRASLKQGKQSAQLLDAFTIEEQSLKNQQTNLQTRIEDIINQLEEVTGKIIY